MSCETSVDPLPFACADPRPAMRKGFLWHGHSWPCRYTGYKPVPHEPPEKVPNIDRRKLLARKALWTFFKKSGNQPPVLPSILRQ